MQIEENKQALVKNLAMLVVALLVGSVGVYMANKYINGKVQFYKSQMDVKEQLTEVVVPKRNMVRGEVVLARDMALRKFPSKYMDSNAVDKNSFNVAIGQKLDFDIDEGKPLLWAHLDGGLMPTFSGKLEDGFRALTIPVDDINSINGFLQPQDRVDLLLTYDGKEVAKKITFPFMQNLEVLATGTKTIVDKTGRSTEKRFNTITVKVTPYDAKRITLARQVGGVTATLRHPDDTAAVSAEAVELYDILGDKAKRPVKRKSIKKEKQGIEFIIGGV